MQCLVSNSLTAHYQYMVTQCHTVLGPQNQPGAERLALIQAQVAKMNLMTLHPPSFLLSSCDWYTFVKPLLGVGPQKNNSSSHHGGICCSTWHHLDSSDVFQLRNSPDQAGLWVCLRRAILTVQWGRKAPHSNVGHIMFRQAAISVYEQRNLALQTLAVAQGYVITLCSRLLGGDQLLEFIP